MIDGTGAPSFHGHIGIRGDQIDQIARGIEHNLTADDKIDGTGAVACPGFIDAHSKSDSKPFSDPLLKPKIRQGITTEIIGHDGYSMAPLYRREELTDWTRVLGGFVREIDDDDWAWEGTAEFLDALEAVDIAPHIGTLVGHGTVRYNVMGLQNETPTDSELEEMGDLVAESLEDGALGLSSGLIYPPQMYSTSEELNALATRLSPYGRPLVVHVRSQGRGVWDAIDELYNISSKNQIPVQHTHIQLSGERQHGKADRALRIMDAVREQGGDLSANQHPYKAGSTRLSALLPPRFQSMDADRLVDQLEEDHVRQQIQRDIEEWRIDNWENLIGLTGWGDVHVASIKTTANNQLEGESLADIAVARNCRPVDVLCDVLLEEDFEADVSLHKLSEADVKAFLRDERISICTDGLFGQHPHPRTYGTYPRVLGEYVREKNVISVEEAVRKMTSLPARQYGLFDRGLLRPGHKADIVVFDPDTVSAQATYDDPTQFPRGIPHVIVNGTAVVRNGDVTGQTPGEVIRQ